MIQIKERTPEEQMEILMGLILELQKEVFNIRRKMKELVEAEVVSAIRPLEAGLALREAVMLKQLLIEKGIITDAEFVAKFKA